MNTSVGYIRPPLGLEDGIPVFSADLYWGKAPAKVLEQALKMIDSSGWKAFDAEYKGRFDFTYDETRADWRFPIEIDKDSVVLDVGAGMGRSTIPLARVAGRVVAFDASSLRMRYLKRRLAKENITNVELCVADIFDLPFADGTFDVISMNGILEWVGKTDRFTNAVDAQNACLAICHRLLRKGGVLYVGIENRFALAYVKAADHGGLHLTSYMPRWMARPYVRFRQGQDYRTYTHTKSGYERLFERAGFQDIRFYLPFPGYNMPRIVWPYEDLNIFSYVIRVMMPANSPLRKLFQLLARFPLFLRTYRHFFYSYNIIAYK